MILGIYGAGGLGREVLDLSRIINEKCHDWEKIIFIDDGDYEDDVNGVKVYSYKDALDNFKKELVVSVAIGEPTLRQKVFKKLDDDGIDVVNLVHPDSYVSDTTKLGKGVTIQNGCFISCNSDIGDYVYIQAHVNVGHNNVLKDGCMLSTLANLGGDVEIGEHSYVGLSTAIKEGVKIGNWSIIGMCSAVYKDIPDEMIAMGNPARPMKKNETHFVFK